MKNINGKTLILYGILIPIVLLMVFGEPYKAYKYQSYTDYLMSADVVFYDGYESYLKQKQSEQPGKAAYTAAPIFIDYTVIQIPFTILAALGLIVAGIGGNKLLTKNKSNES